LNIGISTAQRFGSTTTLSINEEKTGGNVNILCFITSFVIKKLYFLMAGGWAPPNHALPWLRH
jgi:hypothetical protein